MPPRRFTTFVFITGVALTALFLLSSTTPRVASEAVSNIIPPESVREHLPNLPTFEVPNLSFTWHKSIHKPPEQSNSTRGDSSWHSDWKWLNPFSSSVTLDEDRAVLPPLADRPPVYTYYDTTSKGDKDTKEADRNLLLTWRRAWWAKGFKPIVLTDAEAMSHPLYPTLQQQGIPGALNFEFMRWLAWAHMGTGLLASWNCVPMGPYDDLLLAHLRRGHYEGLTKFEGLGTGLFAGETIQIRDALKGSLGDAKLGTYKTIIEAIGPAKFHNEQPSSIAHYDGDTINAKYPALGKILKDDPVKGKTALKDVIAAHLHTTWQNVFSSGISVLKPLPAHSTSLVKPAMDLASLLAECPESLLQSSCPPNRPRCSPCVGSKMRITQSQEYLNVSSSFTISVVPHPYTMITLNNLTSDVTIRHIRRETDRDQWVAAVTRRIMGDGRGGPSRVVSLKDIVASEYGSSRSIWFTTEQFPNSFNPPPPPAKAPTNDAHPEPERIAPFPEKWLEALDWHFGFEVPRTAIPHGESLPPVPGPERWAKGVAGLPEERKKSSDPAPATNDEMIIEVDLLRKARDTMKSKNKDVNKMKRIAEAWNMADAEAWKFVKAFRARADVEREMFEEEEKKFKGTEAVRGKGRWFGS